MYDLPYFKESVQRIVLDFIRHHPFAMLIGAGESAPVATQVPVLIDEREGEALFLRGHIMRNTDHHKAFQRNSQALCVFSGPHTYVSASWYSNPLSGSTWNYMSVHVRGNIRFLDEPELRLLLEKLTAHFENNDNSPALFHHLPKSYVDSMVKAILAFEIEVREIENVFKLSQNRDEQSYDNIIRQLHAQGGDGRAIADEMRKRKTQLFAHDGHAASRHRDEMVS
jgi:transcriptional regulator